MKLPWKSSHRKYFKGFSIYRCAPNKWQVASIIYEHHKKTISRISRFLRPHGMKTADAFQYAEITKQ